MKKLWLALVAVSCVSLIPGAFAQAKAPACPSTATLDDLVKALDQAVSGPGNKDRSCLREIVTPDARLAVMVKNPDGSYAPKVLSVGDWIAREQRSGSKAFYEVQVKHTDEVYGHIAHLWSTYEIRSTPEGKATVRGINSIEAVKDNNGWKVFEILWEAETPAEPLPRKYLP